jgi:hypothetical protein
MLPEGWVLEGGVYGIWQETTYLVHAYYIIEGLRTPKWVVWVDP